MTDAAADQLSLAELRREADVSRAKLGNTVVALRSQVAEATQHVRETISPSAIKATIRDEVWENFHSLQQQARAHPLETSVIAAGLGYCLWKMLPKVPPPLLLIGAGLALSPRARTNVEAPSTPSPSSSLRPLPARDFQLPSNKEIRKVPAVSSGDQRDEKADASSDEDEGAKAADQAVTKNGSIYEAAKQAALQWVAHKDSRLGAALSYYSVFSIGPLILIAVAIAGLVLGREAVQGQVTTSLQGLLGENGAKAINGMLQSADRPTQGIIATIVGVVTLLFAAIGVVVQLKDAFNTVWEVEPSKQGGIWGFIRTYILSLAGVMAVGFLLLISLLVTTALAAFGKYFATFLPEALIQVIGLAVSFAVITALFAMMFKWLPDAPVRWSDVWLGAVLTAVLFEIGKFLIGLYIGKQGLESTYGAASSLVVVLIWVYYSAQLVLLGAEFTNVRAKQRGYSAKERRD